MDALIAKAKDLVTLAHSQADSALESIHKAQKVCDDILNETTGK